MDINELKQFEIFKGLNDKEVSLFKENKSGLFGISLLFILGENSETAFLMA